MQGNGAPIYKLGSLTKAKQQIRNLVARATALGYGKELATSLAEITVILRTVPLDWGEPQYHTALPGGVVRHGALGGLSISFVVYQMQRMVILLDVVPMGDHPLAEQ
jgi:hypothetical protein